MAADTKHSQRLVDAVKRFESAFNEGNTEELRGTLDEKVTLATAEGNVDGRDQVLKFLSQSPLWGRQWLALDGDPVVMEEDTGQPPITVQVHLHGKAKATFRNGMSLATTVTDTMDLTEAGDTIVSICREESSAEGLLSIGREMLRNKRDFVQLSKQYRAAGEPGWAATGIVLGMRLLAEEHQRKISERGRPPKENKARRHTVEDCLYWLGHANAAYSQDKTALLARVPDKCLGPEDVFLYAFHSTLYRPGYYAAVDHSRKAVILSIKGTSNIQDAVRDVCALPRPFGDGHVAHAGMADGAKWLHDKVAVQLEEKCKETGYSLVVTGHSLGAGIAALVAYLLRPALPSLRCVTFASPAAGSLEFGCACEDFVTAVVGELDVVPRLSVGSMDILRREFAAHSEKWTAARLIPTSSLKKVLSLAGARGPASSDPPASPPSTPSPTRKAAGRLLSSAASGLTAAAAKAGTGVGLMGRAVVGTAAVAGKGVTATAKAAGRGTRLAMHATERAKVAWSRRRRKGGVAGEGEEEGGEEEEEEEEEEERGEEEMQEIESFVEGGIIMVPPGTIWMLQRDSDGSDGGGEESYALVKEHASALQSVLVSSAMVASHKTECYRQQLESAASNCIDSP